MFDAETSSNPYADLVAAAVTVEDGAEVINWHEYVDYIDASGLLNEFIVGFCEGLDLPGYDTELEAGVDCPFCAPWTWTSSLALPGIVSPEDVRAVARVYGESVRDDVREHVMAPLADD